MNTATIDVHAQLVALRHEDDDGLRLIANGLTQGALWRCTHFKAGGDVYQRVGGRDDAVKWLRDVAALRLLPTPTVRVLAAQS